MPEAKSGAILESNLQQDSFDDEINLKEIFDVFWNGRKLIVAITALFAVVSVIVALATPNQYIASSVLAPAEQDSGGLSSTLNKLGGLASFAGLNVGAGESSDVQVAIKIMESWAFIDSFIVSNNLQAQVYAAKGWNKDDNKLLYDSDIYDEKNQKWLIVDNDGQYVEPTSWQLYQVFSDYLGVSFDATNGLVSVKIEYYSPYIAQEWVGKFIKEINLHMQQSKLVRVNSNIDYLHVQIEKTSVSYIHEVLYTVIEEQLKNKMFVEATPDNTFVVISPSMLPEEKSRPRRAILCIVGTFLGLVLSLFLVFIIHMINTSRKTYFSNQT